MTQAVQQDFRYAIEGRPKNNVGNSDATHMVVDQRKKVAVFFGDHEECQDWISLTIQR